MRDEEVIFSERAFINKEGVNNMANIVAYITKYRWKKELDDNLENRDLEIYLSIADCERKVSFDFDLDTQIGRDNAVYKTTALIDVLTNFRAALINENVFQKEREELLDKKRKEKEKE